MKLCHRFFSPKHLDFASIKRICLLTACKINFSVQCRVAKKLICLLACWQAQGASCLEYEPTIPTKFMVGTEQGKDSSL